MRLGGIASVAAEIRAFVRFMDVSGFIRPISLNHTLQANRTHSEDTADLIFGDDGWIVGEPTIIGAQSDGSEIEYGTVWSRLRIRDPTLQANVVTIAQGKMGPWKGVQGIEERHPLQGKGALIWNQDGNDVAGNVDTTVNLAATNTRRRILGVLLKYHCSGDVADRTMVLRLRDVADTSGPTGFDLDADVWVSPTLTLSANERGIVYVTEHGFLSENDDGTLTYADNTTAPNPFPLWVGRNDTVDLLADITLGEAADDYDLFTYYEEWFEG